MSEKSDELNFLIFMSNNFSSKICFYKEIIFLYEELHEKCKFVHEANNYFTVWNQEGKKIHEKKKSNFYMRNRLKSLFHKDNFFLCEKPSKK